MSLDDKRQADEVDRVDRGLDELGDPMEGGFDGQVAWEVHRDLVAAIDRGESPELARALARHRPTRQF